MVSRAIYSTLLNRYLLLTKEEGGLRLKIIKPEEWITSDQLKDKKCEDKELLRVIRGIKAYLGGLKVDFGGCMISMDGLTAFERNVLEKVRTIPYGIVCTYADIASSIGNSGAYRAVGTALGKNPAPIIVPCHRVVAKNGIGGYAFGIDIKTKLLSLEGNTIWGDRVGG